jgi:hypothetical protein
MWLLGFTHAWRPSGLVSQKEYVTVTTWQKQVKLKIDGVCFKFRVKTPLHWWTPANLISWDFHFRMFSTFTYIKRLLDWDWNVIFGYSLPLMKQKDRLTSLFSRFQARLRNFENRLLLSSCPSVRMEQLGPTGRTLMKLDILTFFRKSVEKIQVTASRICVACWITKATCTFSHAHANAPGVTRTHALTHGPISNTYFFSTATWFAKAPRCYIYCFSCCRVTCAIWIYTFGKSWLHYWVLSNRIERLTWEVLFSIYHSR